MVFCHKGTPSEGVPVAGRLFGGHQRIGTENCSHAYVEREVNLIDEFAHEHRAKAVWIQIAAIDPSHKLDLLLLGAAVCEIAHAPLRSRGYKTRVFPS